MTREKKHQISKQIVASIEKTEYYRNAIGKMQRHPQTFFEGNFELRLIGTRSSIWGELSISDCISLLRKKLKQELIVLSNLEKLIK